MSTVTATQHKQTGAPQQYESAYDDFVQDYPAYASTHLLDHLRAAHYARLDRLRHVYLDYTGGSLYAQSQLRDHMALLTQNVFGNPYSHNLTSMAMTELVEHTRQYVLTYFNASPVEYEVIFTQNATGALRLVGESYPFTSGSTYLLTFDNHNSVNGIREYARAHGSAVTYIPSQLPDLRVSSELITHHLQAAQPGAHNLFAYPAQSNFTGVQHPLDWIEQAHAIGWDVLLDAASFAPTNSLDLSLHHPDFVALSFYKIFGYPTGIGCLIARRKAMSNLKRPWYSGGTITFSSVVANDHYLTPGPAGYEDGTVNYLSIPAVEIGLKHIETAGIDTIHNRVMCLTDWLIRQLTSLRHTNGKPVIRIYGPNNSQDRGGTVQVNFIDPTGSLIDCLVIERLANERRISLRAGCHCNPGAREIALGFTRDDLAPCFAGKDTLTYEQFLHTIEGKTTGALRASLGIVSNFADVYRYVQFARTFIDKVDPM